MTACRQTSQLEAHRSRVRTPGIPRYLRSLSSVGLSHPLHPVGPHLSHPELQRQRKEGRGNEENQKEEGEEVNERERERERERTRENETLGLRNDEYE